MVSRGQVFQLAALGLVLSLLQVCDGVLTAQAVALYGAEVEANPLIYAAMKFYNPTLTLVAVKTAAIVLILGASALSVREARAMSMMRGALLVGSAAYSLVVLQWTSLMLGLA